MDTQHLALFQGTYYVMTGLWPIISIVTFQKVTGPRRDQWLVKTLGLIIAASGLIYLTAASRNVIPFEVFVLALANASSLALIDLIYIARRRIRKIYLVDAGLEISFLLGWLWPWISK